MSISAADLSGHDGGNRALGAPSPSQRVPVDVEVDLAADEREPTAELMTLRSGIPGPDSRSVSKDKT